jgi:hypothetical protein
VRQGQIAHINRDPSDSRFENLVFLCFEHHDDYDTKRSQSKGFLPEEVRKYRDLLYQQNKDWKAPNGARDEADKVELEPLPTTTVYEKLKRQYREELSFLSDPWRYPLWQNSNEPEYLAYKARNRFDGVCQIERIDLPDGRIVIVCTQAPGNPGNSITNCVEELCFQVCDRFEIPPELLVWIEHYDIVGFEQWSLVQFESKPPDSLFMTPSWTEMTDKIWQGLRLRPRKRTNAEVWELESKVRKLFPWPPK